MLYGPFSWTFWISFQTFLPWIFARVSCHHHQDQSPGTCPRTCLRTCPRVAANIMSSKPVKLQLVCIMYVKLQKGKNK